MGMDSYLELFTTLYGWTIANLIYSVLVDTGIVFVPLIVSIISVWIEAHEEGTDTGSAERAIRKMEVQIFTSLFVMSICFVPTPWTTLDRATLTYRPDGTAMDPSPAPVTANASGTTYDQAFGQTAASVPVPMWWYTVIGLSSGVNSALRAGISGDGFLALREVEERARLATIEDPGLRGEAQAFFDECYRPAHSRFHVLYNVPTQEAAAIAADDRFGRADTEWIGSRTFQVDPQYYQSIRATSVVRGFEQDRATDDSDATEEDVGSRPNCNRWWTDPNVGLRARLTSELATTADEIWARLQDDATRPSPLTQDFIEDQVLRQALWKSHSNFAQTEQITGGDSGRSGVTALISKFGIFEKSLESSLSAYPVVQFLTLAQPLILMAVYIFMPIVVVLSRYSLSFMMTGSIGIFTVKFWASMWAVARYVDERLILAMYNSDTVLLREFFTNGLDGGAKRSILNALTLGLYIVLPTVWSGMMAWIGFSISKGISQAIETANLGGLAAGKASFNQVKTAATAAAKAAMKV